MLEDYITSYMWGGHSKIWVRYMIIKLYLKSKFIFLIKSLICLKYRENYTSSNFHGTSMNFYHKRINSADHLFQTIDYASKIQNMLPFDSWQYKNKTILLASEIKNMYIYHTVENCLIDPFVFW